MLIKCIGPWSVLAIISYYELFLNKIISSFAIFDVCWSETHVLRASDEGLITYSAEMDL